MYDWCTWFQLNDPLQYFDFFTTLFPRFAEIALPLQDAINDSDLPKAAEVRRESTVASAGSEIGIRCIFFTGAAWALPRAAEVGSVGTVER